jgi:hypothetical protein
VRAEVPFEPFVPLVKLAEERPLVPVLAEVPLVPDVRLKADVPEEPDVPELPPCPEVPYLPIILVSQELYVPEEPEYE